jgi:hypothetical protein
VVAAIQPRRQLAVFGAVGVNVGVEQHQLHAPHLNGVGLGINGAARQLHIDHDFAAILGEGRAGRDVGEVQLAILGILPAAMVEALAEIALGVNEAHRHKRQIKIAGLLNVVARQHA